LFRCSVLAFGNGTRKSLVFAGVVPLFRLFRFPYRTTERTGRWGATGSARGDDAFSLQVSMSCGKFVEISALFHIVRNKRNNGTRARKCLYLLGFSRSVFKNVNGTKRNIARRCGNFCFGLGGLGVPSGSCGEVGFGR
jgi:hypothetical protein